MGALMSVLVSIFRSYLSQAALVHPFGLPFPAQMHKTLSAELIASFKQVLVIGDVHGCYNELMDLLQSSKAHDRDTLKLFVGDLVNKGPQNERVLDYLMTNNVTCQSVRGNHDEVVLREYLASRDPDYKLSPENSWIGQLNSQQAHFLQELPYTISLPSLNTIIVHAGLVPGLDLNTSPKDMVSMRNLVVKDPWEEGGIQGLSKEKEGSQPWGSLWNGPAHVYFGHDAVRKLQEWPHCTGLDTGCVYGGSLTGVFITGPSARKMVSVKASQVHKNPFKSEG
ncbi:unnamed protein product [Ixodes hexagonus]